MIASCTLVASVTLTVTAVVVVYTDVRCPACNRRVMAVPGRPTLEVRVRRSDAERSGRGVVTGCGRCKALIEVIERREAA
jgi:DNA-directed RNA polymerase subunit RPC12/RpoP